MPLAHLGVGIIAGAPKSCKSWLALDMAVSVASNADCLGYPVISPGRVLVYMAEDSLAILYQRLKALVCHKSVELETLNLGILVPDSLRLDRDNDRKRLENTVENEKPALIVLDPMVRMHAIDENCSSAVSGILAYLRNLQRKYNTAVCVVHHTRKNGASASHPGLGMRGSSDFHAWGDTNLYIKKREDCLVLTREQRAAPMLDPLIIKLVQGSEAMPHLEVLKDSKDAQPKDLTMEDKIIAQLEREGAPISQNSLRDQLKIRNQFLTQTLKKLQERGAISKGKKGWSIMKKPEKSRFQKTVPVPTLRKKPERNKNKQLTLPLFLNKDVEISVCV
jgi:biotin operon repressor